MSDLTAFICEECEFDERGPIATGLFSCHVESADGDPRLDDFAETSLVLAEALQWGRVRADQVAVRIAGEDYYSAGRIAGDEPPLDESRRLGRRRPTGWEFLDRSEADAPILWDVIVEVDTLAAGGLASRSGRTELGERWRRSLELAGACHVVEMATTGADGRVNSDGGGWVGYASTPAAVLRVDARGYEGAITSAVAAASQAARAAGWEPTPTFSVQYAFATDSDAARTNAHVDANGILF